MINIHGHNNGACYNHDKHIFEVNDNITLTIENKKYILVEYHFHVTAEHIINNKLYESEIHYVFMEVNKMKHHCYNICEGNVPIGTDIVVIGKCIENDDIRKSLDKIQVKLPISYFMYDGSLTTGDFSPVRWIVDSNKIYMNIHEIKKVAKTARKIQPLDGRIILYNE
jgi:carbonic anhydrase